MKILLKIFSLRAQISLCRTLSAALLSISILSAGINQVYAETQPQAQEPLSQAELEQILAPIALYPDTILSHILVASTYPLEVVQAERWTLQHPKLQGQDAVQAAQQNNWDPSVQALVAFPQILKRMSQDLEWTQRLGDAFLQDEQDVLASVQNLRELAEQSGSLDKMDKLAVSHERRSIIIEPRERQVVYVPYYDTRVVYGNWRWARYQPIFWDYPYHDRFYYNDYYAHNRASSFYWGPRVVLSFGFFSNSFNWRNHQLVRISPQHYQPNHYYNHNDILNHRYAERWVHDENRRHNTRNIARDSARNDIANQRDFRRDGYPTQQAQIQRSQVGKQWNQAQVQDKLAQQRRAVTTNQSTSNSSSTMSDRARAFEDNRRVVNRPITRPLNSQTTLKSYRQPTQVTAPRAQQQSATTPVARPTSTPTPQPSVSRPTVAPRPVVTKREQTTMRTQSANRIEGRQRQVR